MATATSLDIETPRAPARRRTSRLRLFGIKRRNSKAPPNSPELITNLLSQRVRIALADRVHWMTGYDALSLLLNDRVGRGDARAGELLAHLVKYPAPQGNRQPALDGAIAPSTPTETKLEKAFAQRMLDRGSVKDRRRAPA
jgi:hypothetical protein